MREPDSSPTEYGDAPESYQESVVESPLREYGEWATVTSLLPDVDGKRILDIACGPGVTSARLADRGATVVGVDVSEGMLRHAREQYGEAATFRRADLREPLDFADDSFDVVVSQFTLEFVKDWSGPVGEFRRVLAPGGTVIVSINHPFVEYLMTRYGELPDFEGIFDADDQPSVVTDAEHSHYFEVERYRTIFDSDDQREILFYRRPLNSVVGPFLEHDFAITGLRELGTRDELMEAHPEFAERVSDEPPLYLCLRAEPR